MHASGLSVNQTKSEIVTIHHSDISDVWEIKVEQTVKKNLVLQLINVNLK